MPDSPDRTHDILMRVAEFLRKLPEDEYDALASGEARLVVLPKGARVTGPAAPKPSAAVTLPVSAEEMESDLRAFGDRASATTYLDDLKLTRPQLAEFADRFGIAVSSKMTASQIRQLIVDLKVGQRLVTNAILRH